MSNTNRTSGRPNAPASLQARASLQTSGALVGERPRRTSSTENLAPSRPLTSLRFWPIVLIELPRVIDDAGVDEVIATIESAFARREPFLVLADTGHMRRPPSPTQRRRLAAFAEQNAHRTVRYARGTAYVITNSLLHGAVNALHWLFRPPTAMNRFRSRAGAVSWSVESLAASGIDAGRVGRLLMRASRLNNEFAEAV